MRLTQWFEEFTDDVRFALRQLKASPGFALVAVLTLALGIGANSAMFALADATLVRALPFPESDRIVALSEIWQGRSGGAVNPVDFIDWSERTRSFTAIAAVVTGAGSIVGDDGVAEQIPAQAVTSRFFDVLGVRPIAGRTFRDEDEGPAPDVVVLSEGFWRRRFGADPALVGRPTRFGGQTFTVIGVVPADFQFDLPGTTSAGPSMMWTLLNPPRDRGPAQRYPHYLQVIGRLKPGVAVESARTDIAAVADAIARETPGTNKGHVATADPLRVRVIGRELRLTAILLLGVVGLVLLMCCANVANLLLARASARSREFAIRSALGAGRRRIARQVLSESLVLSVMGGLLGGAVGAAILEVAPSFIPPGLLPAAVTLGFDARVVTFCAVAAVVVAALYGLSPAWQVSRMSSVQAMTADGRTSDGRERRVQAGARHQPGCRRRVPVVWCWSPAAHARGARRRRLRDPRTRPAQHGDQCRRARSGGQRPGVDVAEIREPTSVRSSRSPVCAPSHGEARCHSTVCGTGRPFRSTVTRRGRPPTAIRPAIKSSAHLTWDSLVFLSSRVVDSLKLTQPGAHRFVSSIEEFVRRFLRGRPVLGTRIAINAMVVPPQAVTREIVGVVGQVKERPEEPEPQPHVYVPIAQNPWWGATLVVEPADGRAEALTSEVRAALAESRPGSPRNTHPDADSDRRSGHGQAPLSSRAHRDVCAPRAGARHGRCVRRARCTRSNNARESSASASHLAPAA